MVIQEEDLNSFEQRYRTQLGTPIVENELNNNDDLKDSMSNSMLQFVKTYGIAVQKVPVRTTRQSGLGHNTK